MQYIFRALFQAKFVNSISDDFKQQNASNKLLLHTGSPIAKPGITANTIKLHDILIVNFHQAFFRVCLVFILFLTSIVNISNFFIIIMVSLLAQWTSA